MNFDKLNKMAKVIDYHSELLSDLIGEISTSEQLKTDKRMQLAARIYSGIKARGWKKKDLANALNKKPSVITKWLSGTHNFGSDTLFDIEEVLNIKLVNVQDETKEQRDKFYLSISETVQMDQKAPFPWGFIAMQEYTSGHVIRGLYKLSKKVGNNKFEYQS